MKNKIYIAIICAFSIVFAVSSGFIIKHYYDSAKQAEMYDNLIGVVETEPEESNEPMNYSEDKTFIPEYQELRLSEAYLEDKEEREEDALPLIVKVYNINSEKNAEILKKCETLRQYSRFVEIVRSYGHIDQLTSAAMVQIMAQCQQENVLAEFMEHYGTELIEMLFKELTREEDLEISRLDGYDAGVKDGEKSGFTKGEKSGERKAALDIAKGMKRKNLDSSVITELTGLSLAEVESL